MEVWILQDVAAQVLILDNVGELFVHIGGIDLDVFLFQVGGFEGKLVENFFENGVKAARADIFGLLVHASCKLSDRRYGIFSDVELHAFGFEQRDILFDKRVLGLGKNTDEIFLFQR